MKRITAYILVVVSLVFLAACQDNKTNPAHDAKTEEEFKAIATELKSMLVDFESVPPLVLAAPEDLRPVLRNRGKSDEEIEKFIESGRTVNDETPIYNYFQQESDRWKDLTERLQKFYTDNPGTKWTDDTLFLMTLLPYMPGRNLGTYQFIKFALKTMVTTPVDLEIEPWTLETMGSLRTVSAIMDDNSMLLPKDMDINRKITGLYKFSYAVILIEEGDKDGGRDLLKQLQRDYEGTYMEKVVKEQLAKMTEFKE